MDDNKIDIEQLTLSESQKLAQRHRAKGLAIALFLFVLLVYAATMAHVSA
ncbi:hypothetical protein [Bartonella sp. LJL80]